MRGIPGTVTDPSFGRSPVQTVQAGQSGRQVIVTVVLNDLDSNPSPARLREATAADHVKAALEGNDRFTVAGVTSTSLG